jgi:hypothetical protein
VKKLAIFGSVSEIIDSAPIEATVPITTSLARTVSLLEAVGGKNG